MPFFPSYLLLLYDIPMPPQLPSSTRYSSTTLSLLFLVVVGCYQLSSKYYSIHTTASVALTCIYICACLNWLNPGTSGQRNDNIQRTKTKQYTSEKSWSVGTEGVHSTHSEASSYEGFGAGDLRIDFGWGGGRQKYRYARWRLLTQNKFEMRMRGQGGLPVPRRGTSIPIVVFT